jgi:hypothetical protein
MQLYLDMDGVLADFDTAASNVLGMESAKFEFRYGTKEFWRRLDAVPNFFATFKPMPDMERLWHYVNHLRPIVLTALPKKDSSVVREDKIKWIHRHLNKEVKVLTCLTSEKSNYCQPGDILVDDRNINEEPWNAKGGHFIHHIDATHTLIILKHYKVID